MKRDMDLIREILFQLERAGERTHLLKSPEGYSPNETSYHARLLLEAGLIESRRVASFDATAYRDLRLTWQGHELLDTIRSPAVWDEVRKRLRHFGGAALTIVKALAVEEAKKLLGMA